MARRRYVPKTYNNRRGLRIIGFTLIILLLAFVVLFLSLFFVFQSYVVDGQLVIPWLEEYAPSAPPTQSTEATTGPEDTTEPDS